MDYTEFRDNIKHIYDSRKPTLTGSLGIRKIFLFLLSNKWFDIGQSLKESQFQKIIRNVNKLIADKLSEGSSWDFPYGLGGLVPIKYKAGIVKKDNKLKIKYSVKWDDTLKLWYENPEAKEKKILVYERMSLRYKLHYNKKGCHMKNMKYIDFKVSRNIKIKFKDNINQGKIDAYIL